MGSIVFDVILPFIVVLGVLVFFHELGHHLAAKLFGMKVDAFSLGFPPRAWGFRWGSKRLRVKFKKDIRTALSASPSFQRVMDLTGHGENRDVESAMQTVLQAIDIRSEEIKTIGLNKKGKEVEKTEEKLFVEKRANSSVPTHLVDSIHQLVSSDNELADLFLKFRDIEDDTAFQQKYTTDYCVSWLPLGGYCKINGMIDESFDTESMKEGKPMPWEYRAKPIWQRVIAILGGIVFNFLLAIVIYFGIALMQGVPDVDRYNEYKLGTQISGVNENSPAEKAGLKAGDRLIAVDGKKVDDWREIVELIRSNPEKPMVIEWIRNGELMQAEITPTRFRTQTSEGIQDIGQIGIAAPVHPDFVKQASITDAVVYGVANTYFVTRLILTNLKQIVVGDVSFKETMGGPVAIVKMTGEVKKQQGWEGILSFMALLSISLAVFNLFPIPALDGGHFVMLMVEGIIRRPLSIKFKLYAQQIGMALLLTFIAYVTFNDLTR